MVPDVPGGVAEALSWSSRTIRPVGTEEATMANPKRTPVIWRRYVADADTVERGEALRSAIARGEEQGESAEEIRAFFESGGFRPEP